MVIDWFCYSGSCSCETRAFTVYYQPSARLWHASMIESLNLMVLTWWDCYCFFIFLPSLTGLLKNRQSALNWKPSSEDSSEYLCARPGLIFLGVLGYMMWVTVFGSGPFNTRGGGVWFFFLAKLFFFFPTREHNIVPPWSKTNNFFFWDVKIHSIAKRACVDLE